MSAYLVNALQVAAFFVGLGLLGAALVLLHDAIEARVTR